MVILKSIFLLIIFSNHIFAKDFDDLFKITIEIKNENIENSIDRAFNDLVFRLIGYEDLEKAKIIKDSFESKDFLRRYAVVRNNDSNFLQASFEEDIVMSQFIENSINFIGRNRPIIFLSNTTGFLVGKKYEHAGMIKHGSKMIQAVMNVRVPKLSFYIGASFGAGNYGMCGFEFNPDFLFTWPNAQIGVMGGQQAALTMENVISRAATRKGNKINKKNLIKQLDQVKIHFDKQCNAFYTSGRLLDHGMIDPRDTRKVIGICLSVCLDSRTRTLYPNTFGVARP